MSYVDSQEFQEKAQRFRERLNAQRQAFGRAMFDADTAGTAGVTTPSGFCQQLGLRDPAEDQSS